jgi:hypothetical protein
MAALARASAQLRIVTSRNPAPPIGPSTGFAPLQLMPREGHDRDVRPGSAGRVSPCSRRDFRPAAWQDRSLAWLGAMLARGPAMLGQNPCRLRAATSGAQAGTKNRRLVQPNKERTMDRANSPGALCCLGNILDEATTRAWGAFLDEATRVRILIVALQCYRARPRLYPGEG